MSEAAAAVKRRSTGSGLYGENLNKGPVDLATARFVSTPADMFVGPVESAIPAPPTYLPRQPGRITTAVMELAVGESRLIRGPTMVQIRSACSLARKKLAGSSFSAREDGDGVRVWRRT